MLARGRRLAAEADVEIDWIEADMRELSLEHQFGLVIVPSQSFQHLHTREDVERTLAQVRQHLAPGGAFFLQLFVPSPDLLARTLADGGPFTTSEPFYEHVESGVELSASIRARYDPASQVMHSTYRYKSDDGSIRGSFDLSMRQFFPQEIDALLHYNGFEILGKYGDLDRTPFAEAPEYQHIVCRPRSA
jgi:SAM-dependent methyltransferase